MCEKCSVSMRKALALDQAVLNIGIAKDPVNRLDIYLWCIAIAIGENPPIPGTTEPSIEETVRETLDNKIEWVKKEVEKIRPLGQLVDFVKLQDEPEGEM